jgi:proteasome lid subunit RPN8/RPN11
VDLTDTQIIERDASAIQSADWPLRNLTTFNGIRESRFQVVYRQSVLDEIHLHGQGSSDIEVCGVLIGTCHRDHQGPYLLIEHCIRGNGALTKSTNVTFTAETWAHIQTVMDRDFAEKKMVGWYHTHPGFGIFLSDMDVFICDNFFNLPWQVAFVYDPLGGDEGNFVWKAGRPDRQPVLIEDDVTPKSAQIPLITLASAMAKETDTFGNEVEAKILELLIRVRRLEKRQKKLLAAMAFLAAFVIMYLVEFMPVTAPPAVKSSTQPTTQPLPMGQAHPPG